MIMPNSKKYIEKNKDKIREHKKKWRTEKWKKDWENGGREKQYKKDGIVEDSLKIEEKVE